MDAVFAINHFLSRTAHKTGYNFKELYALDDLSKQLLEYKKYTWGRMDHEFHTDANWALLKRFVEGLKEHMRGRQGVVAHQPHARLALHVGRPAGVADGVPRRGAPRAAAPAASVHGRPPHGRVQVVAIGARPQHGRVKR